MACSDVDQPEALPAPVSPDWIRLASARPGRLFPAFPGTGGAEIR